MIETRINEHDLLELWIYDQSPTVYLDHWAIQDISCSRELSTRFITALRHSGGTLGVSCFNIVEFIRMTDRAQAVASESLVESALPNVIYIDCDPSRVIDRENDLMRSGPRKAPHIDYELGNAFFHLKPTSLQPYTATGLFTSAQRDDLVSGFDHLCDTIVGRLDNLRQQRELNPDFRKDVDGPLTGPPIQRGTRYLLREVVRNQLRDEKHSFTRNDAMDLLHTVVPVSYCDFVLLDAHSCTRIGQVEKRIREAGLSFPMAECFAGRKNGVERFLSELEKRGDKS